MRTFIAIELPDDIRSALDTLTVRLRASRIRASWVRAENIHLTLRFLGEISVDHVQRLSGILASAYKDTVPFFLIVRGTGAFPNVRNPNIVWAGVEPAEGPLEKVQAAAETAALSIGCKAERRSFHPHLTLARIKDPAEGRKLLPYLAEERNWSAGAFQAAGVSLFSSQLTPHGAMYTRLAHFPFEGAGAG